MPAVPDSDRSHFEQVLGYLNFSAGHPDPNAMRALDHIFRWAGTESPWQRVHDELLNQLELLSECNGAFADPRQARRVLSRTRDDILPAYQEFHRDLLFHQSDHAANPFFVGRIFEAVLSSDEEAETSAILRQLCDYIGHRPVPVLESQRIEPYAHEWVRPLPLYIREAGVCLGPHELVLQRALELLESTDADILREACLDPAMLDEVSLDPRAYDFDHPVNKRPNYHFGQWDPNLIDNRGHYRRFVIQQVTLESLLVRVSEPTDLDPDECLEEAAAVLAGTMLMAAGVSGWGPSCHSSDVTLGNLLPRIAKYRDEFYARLIKRLPPRHRERLDAEAEERRQPFGAARQSLNTELGNRRAKQLQHVVLARVFASMGHPEAARRQVEQVHVASARMTCTLECLLTDGDRAARRGEIQGAAEILAEVRDLLLRAIECGSLADPWSVLGFNMNFSLFPSLENSVHDHRVDELVGLVERIFQLHARVWSEAAARDDQRHCDEVEQLFQSLALWWRQFAVHEVSAIDCGDSQQGYMAAKHVADGLNLWHKGGAAAGAVKFWAPHAAMFDSPKAYTLLIERLLERDDHVASMALLVHWLNRNEELPLEQGDASFHHCAIQWIRAVRRHSEDPWQLTAKFLDYVEANAETYGEAPEFEIHDGAPSPTLDAPAGPDPDHEPEDGDDSLFGAAYEDMVFRDSTDDGIDSELAGEAHSHSDDELTRECHRVAGRLDFIVTLSTLWTMAAVPVSQNGDKEKEKPPADGGDGDDKSAAQLRQWIEHAARVRGQLRVLMRQVASQPIPAPAGDHESMMEYDRRRLLKESLLEQVISTEVEVAAAVRMLAASLLARDEEAAPSGCTEEEWLASRVTSCLLQLDTGNAERLFRQLLQKLEGQPLLYVPLSRGGAPEKIVAARVRQHCLRDLLKLLPRAGLLRQVGQLLEAAREMERNQASIVGAVTEFDELFNTGYGALVECLARSGATWSGDRQQAMVSCLEQLTESVLVSWLTHSRTLRLSVLERVSGEPEWTRLVEFITRFGDDLFTQQFLNLGNVRAILHCGVQNWLEQMQEEPEWNQPKLIRELESCDLEHVVEQLTIVLESIIENYAEYRDYNSTTTLSDDGKMLFSLLDFLRLRSRYDRVSWHLKPVVLAHEILVRNELNEAAELWRRALNERIESEAERYIQQLRKLQGKYAMRLCTVADRLGERFIKPLMVDRLVAMVAPAIREGEHADHAASSLSVFPVLERELEQLAEEPSGAGLDVPAWLVAIDEEVQHVRLPEFDQELQTGELGLPSRILTYEQIQDQLDNWNPA